MTSSSPEANSRRTVDPSPALSVSGDVSGPVSGTASGPAADPSVKRRATLREIRELLPDVYRLIRPRRWVLLAGLLMVGVNRVASLVLPASSKVLIDDVIGKHANGLLLPLVAAVLVATAVQGLSGFFLTQSVSKAAQRLIAQLRVETHQHVLRLPLAYFDQQKTGALVTRVMNDVEGLRNLIGTGLIDFVGGLCSSLIAFAVLVRISPLLTAVTVVFVVTLGWGLAKAFRRLRPVFRARAKLQGEVTGRLTESLGGIRVVKSYRAEKHEESVFAAGVERLLQNVTESLSLVAWMGLQSSVALGLVGGVTMYLGVHQIQSGALTLGGFVTFTLFLGFLVAPIAQVASVGTQMSEAFAGLERMKEVLREVPEGIEPCRTVEFSNFTGAVDFESVSFAYRGGAQVLHGVSFSARPGSVTALVGRSGAGKSTIISLLAALYAPTEGRVLVDGIDLTSARLESYRPHLGMVLQETFLFDGTIRENVLFSRPAASEEEFLEACRVAHVDEFALGLPSSFDTVVGERGVKLSGGQRQRIAIARALLVNPGILILDEATASLDTESERFIQDGLARLMAGRTVFVIAHRLSTVQQADLILVIDGGRVVEHGTHRELIDQHGLYAGMVALQTAALRDRLEPDEIFSSNAEQ